MGGGEVHFGHAGIMVLSFLLGVGVSNNNQSK